MGLPALRHEASHSRARAPRLSVVPAKRTKPVRSCSPAARVERARSVFRTFALCAIVVTIMGVGRVWLSVEAAEASMEANQLRTDIKSELYEGDMLEVRQSALGSPSRIRAIAGQAMNMAPARTVTYLDLQKPETAVDAAPEKALATPDRSASGVAGLVASVMDLTAGEASVLLIGDVGLSASR